MLFLCLLHKKDLKQQRTHDLFEQPLLLKWMNGKINPSQSGVFV